MHAFLPLDPQGLEKPIQCWAQRVVVGKRNKMAFCLERQQSSSGELLDPKLRPKLPLAQGDSQLMKCEQLDRTSEMWQRRVQRCSNYEACQNLSDQLFVSRYDKG